MAKKAKNAKPVKVVVARVGKPAVVEEVEPELVNLQKIVGGDLEAVGLPDLGEGVLLYVNEDGIRENLPQNRREPPELLGASTRDGWLLGDIFIMAHGASGEARSLRSREIARAMTLLDSGQSPERAKGRGREAEPGGVRVRSVQSDDAVSCTGCGVEDARSVVEVGRPAYGPTELRLCEDCFIALEGALTTHRGSGFSRGKARKSSGA